MKKQTKPTKPLARHHKIIAVGVAVLAAVGLVTGTLAWTSKDKDSDTGWGSALDVGANMHDDFDGRYNRDIYAENYAQADVYVRILLREYLEIGTGTNSQKFPTTATKSNVRSWEIHYQDRPNNSFSEWWKWTQGSTAGERYYLPTDPDAANREEIQKPGAPNNYSPEYFYDKAYAEAQSNLGLRPTLGARVMTMAQWKALPSSEKVGDYWVGDTDGWYYWAAPLAGGTATGLLLNAVELTRKIGNPYYYGINATFDATDDDDIQVMLDAATADAQALLLAISEYDTPSTALDRILKTAKAKLDEPDLSSNYTSASIAELRAAYNEGVLLNTPTATDAAKAASTLRIRAALNLVPAPSTVLALKAMPDPVADLRYPAGFEPTYGTKIVYTKPPYNEPLEEDFNIWYWSYQDILPPYTPYELHRPGAIPLEDIIADYDDTKPTTITVLDPALQGNNPSMAGGPEDYQKAPFKNITIGPRWRAGVSMTPGYQFDTFELKTSILFQWAPVTLPRYCANIYDDLGELSPGGGVGIDLLTGESYRTTVTPFQGEVRGDSPIISTDVILEHQGKRAKVRISYVVARHSPVC